MRVVSGKVRGLKLQAPKGEATRPTADRCKEALFNILNSMAPELFDGMQERYCLDLCAGSGQIAIEALSRGFAGAVLVENNRLALQAISANLQKADLAARSFIQRTSVQDFIKRYVQNLQGRDAYEQTTQAYGQTTQGKSELYNLKFDFIYCDPPYKVAAGVNAEVLNGAVHLLAKGGILVLEQAAAAAPPVLVNGDDEAAQAVLSLLKEQTYGAAKLLFYRKQV